MKRTPSFLFAVLLGLRVCQPCAAQINQPPVVSMIPTFPTTAADPGGVHGIYLFLGVNAADPDGQIVSVEYFVGTTSIGIVSNDPPHLYSPDGSSILWPIIFPPFGFFWSLPSGEYEIRAKATDDQGATAISDPLHVIMIGPPVVNIEATDAQASESGDPGAFTIRRSGDSNGDLRVYYFVGGSASNGVDFVAISNSVVIPAGRDSVQIAIEPVDDQQPDGRQSVLLQLYYPIQWLVPAVYPPLPPAYYVGTNSWAVVYIADDDGGPVNRHPRVRIVQPANREVFAPGSVVLLAAEASDPDTFVQTVEFFDGAERIGTAPSANAPPAPGAPATFQFLWWDAPVGQHVLRARATDTAGRAQVSPAVHIRVR